MYLLSSVGQHVSHSENTSPNPVGPPDAIKGIPGTTARRCEPGRPLFSFFPLGGHPYSSASTFGGEEEGESRFVDTALIFDSLLCVLCPFAPAGF